MFSKKQGLFTLLAVLLAAGVLLYGGAGPSGRDVSRETRPVSGVQVGNLLQEFHLKDIAGKEVAVGGPGRITVLNFWATWCPPCRGEMPELERFARTRDSVAFYAVNIQETPDKVNAFLQENQLTMPVLLDRQGEIARMYRISAIPTTIVTDRQGVIRFRKTGPVTENELAGVIKGL